MKALGDALQRLALTIDRLLLAEGDPTREDVRALRLLATDALHALSAVVDEVHGWRWGGDLEAALRSIVDDYAQATGAAPHVRIRGSVGRLPDDVAAAIRRVAVEALANVDRHARASVLVVSLDIDDEGVVLDIVDDGVGLSGRQSTAWGSSVELGLRRMSRALRAVGGTLTVHPLQPRGVRLHAAVPVAVRSVR